MATALIMLSDNQDAFAGGYLQGTVLLAAGLWLTPRVMGQHLGLRNGLEAQAGATQARAEQLTGYRRSLRPRTRWTPRPRG